MDFAEDEIGIGGPDERVGIFATLVEVVEHDFLQNPNSGAACAADTALSKLREEPLDEIEPIGAEWGEVNVVARVLG